MKLLRFLTMSLLLLWACGAQAQFVSDTFTGSQSTRLDAHTANVGGTWAVDTAQSAAGFYWFLNGSGGAVSGGGSNATTNYNPTSPSTTEYDVQATFTPTGSPGGSYFVGPVSHDTSATGGNQAYMFLYAGSTGVWQIYKYTAAGTGSAVGTSTTAAWVSGTGYVVKLSTRLVGGNLVVSGYVNGTLYSTFTETGTGFAKGYPGLEAFGLQSYTSNVVVSNFSATNLQNTSISSATPSPINTSATTTVTFVGSGTHWTTTAPTISLANTTTTATAGTVTVVDDTHVTCPISTNGTAGSFIATLTNVTDGALTAPSVTVSVPTNTLDASATNFRSGFSPASWYYNSSAKTMTCVNPGNGATFAFTGTSFALSSTVAGTTYIRYSVDGGAWVSANTGIISLSGLSNGPPHTVRVEWYSGSVSENTWTPSTYWVINSVTLDTSVTLSVPSTLRTNNLLCLGDSITYGAYTLGVGSNDATQTWCTALASALDANLGVCGRPGGSWNATSADGAPSLPSFYNFICSGAARSFTGLTHVAINMGTNPTGSGGTVGSAGTVSGFLTSLRAAVPVGCKILLMAPYNATQAANLLTEFRTYQGGSGNVTTLTLARGKAYKGTFDANTVYLDNSAITSYGLAGAASIASGDGIHPYAAYSEAYGAGTAFLYQATQSTSTSILVKPAHK